MYLSRWNKFQEASVLSQPHSFLFKASELPPLQLWSNTRPCGQLLATMSPLVYSRDLGGSSESPKIPSALPSQNVLGGVGTGRGGGREALEWCSLTHKTTETLSMAIHEHFEETSKHTRSEKSFHLQWVLGSMYYFQWSFLWIYASGIAGSYGSSMLSFQTAIQHSMVAYMGKETEKEWRYIYIWFSLLYTWN